MSAGRRYDFDGQQVTAAELARRITIYSEPWLGEALKAGCRTAMDLALRYHESKKRERLGGAKGSRRTAKLHPMNNRRLRETCT